MKNSSPPLLKLRRTSQLPLYKRGGVKKQKVLVALSGGIDSAVSAYLLIKQGYQVEVAFMKNWSSTEGLLKNDCPWLQDRQDALRVAAFLKISLHTLDFEKEYQSTVMDYFFKEYKAGRTPNPDVMCNKEIKFKLLYDWAMAHGFDFLATGHYARIASSGKRLASSFNLMRSADEFKDQTYFIYNINTNQLPRILFPIGGMKKSAVRSLARKIKLPNAEKKESMGLCFVGKIRLQDFLNQKLKPKPGEIILAPSTVSLRGNASDRSNLNKGKIAAPAKGGLAMAEKVIGQHHGLHYYTIGQRQGIKVGAGGPYYVFRKDLKTNTLYVTNNPDDKKLETKEVDLHSVNWIGEAGLRASTSAKATADKKVLGLSKNNLALSPKTYNLSGRFRHQGELVPLTVRRHDKNHYQITFKKPQKALASGQSLVLYDGKVCVGGGVIV